MLLTSFFEHAGLAALGLLLVLSACGTPPEPTDEADRVVVLHTKEVGQTLARLVDSAEQKLATGDRDGALRDYEKALTILDLYPYAVEFTPDAEELKRRIAGLRGF